MDPGAGPGPARPRPHLGWPNWSLARLRRVTVGWIVVDAVTVWSLAAVGGVDAPPTRAVAVATTVVTVVLAAATTTVVVSTLHPVPEDDRFRVLRVGAGVSVLAIPSWFAVAALVG